MNLTILTLLTYASREVGIEKASIFGSLRKKKNGQNYLGLAPLLAASESVRNRPDRPQSFCVAWLTGTLKIRRYGYYRLFLNTTWEGGRGQVLPDFEFFP